MPVLGRWRWGLVLAGLVLVLSSWFAPDWGLRFGLIQGLQHLGWARVQVADAALSLFQGTIVIQRVQLSPDQGLNGLDLRFRWKPLWSRRVSVESLSATGLAITIRQTADGLVISGLPLALGGPGIESSWGLDVTHLDLTDSHIRLENGDGLTLDLQVDHLEINDLRSWEKNQPCQFRLLGRINGSTVSLDGTGTPFADRPRLDGAARIENLDLAGLDALTRQHGLAHLRGRADAALSLSLDEDWRIDGHLVLHDLETAAGDLSARARTIRLDGQARPGVPPQASLSAQIQGLAVDLDGQTLIRLGQVSIRQMRWDKTGVGIQSLDLDAPSMVLKRDRDGLILPQRQAGSASLPALRLGRVQARNGNIRFEDHSLPEPVRLVLSGLTLMVSDLDSQNPGGWSGFTAQAKAGNASMTGSGKIRPFLPQPQIDGQFTLRAVELPPLSAYAAHHLGMNIKTGQLGGDVHLKIQDNRLDGSMALTLAQLYLTAPETRQTPPPAADLPLETVLDLLRDSNGLIRLTIPVRGDLDKPDFDISDAVSQAVGGALRSTALTTFKLAFPLAALIGLVVDEANNPHLALEPLTFAPAATEPNAAGRDRLLALAQVLTERPGLTLTLCGVAAQDADGAALDGPGGVLFRLQKTMGLALDRTNQNERLTRLAEQRANQAKNVLVEQGHINPNRLFTCRPRLDQDKNGTGRIELRF